LPRRNRRLCCRPQTAIREKDFRYVDDGPLQLALRELRTGFSAPRLLVVLAALILVLGLSGPFGTFSSSDTPHRFAYWAAVVLSTYGLARVVIRLAMRYLPPWPPLPRAIAEAVICGVPVTLLVLGINYLAFGDSGLDPLLLWVSCTLIAGAAIAVAQLGGWGDAPPPEGLAASAEARPAILDRVPLPQRGRLVALSVEDHYVEVSTDKGSALILMRLGDAIRETAPVPGLQIHRSHWVALEAVRRVVRAEGRIAVELADGRRLPISRGYLPAARAAGLVAT
jgi:hypothetical protein